MPPMAAEVADDAKSTAAAARPEEAGYRPHLRRNFLALLAHGMLGQTGFRLLQAPTFLPAYLSLLAGNNSAVGIARGLQSLGMSISPYLGAWMVEHRRYVKRMGIVFGSVMRLQILLLALAALLIPPRAALPVVWTVIGIWGFASGFQGVTFNFVISKAIPAHRRGRLLGMRNASAGVTLLFVSAIGGWILERRGFPAGYGWTFMLAFGLTSLGLVAFSTIREPGTAAPKRRLELGMRLRGVPALFRSDRDFARYVVARLLGTAGRGALPFYILYVGESYELSGARLAVLTILFTLAEAAGAISLGLVADRTGFRAVFLCGIGLWMAGNALALATPALWAAYGVFFLVGAGFAGFRLASQNLVLEFGDEADLPMRIAATNATSELVGMTSFLAAGLLADLASLVWVFWLSLAFQLATVAQTLRFRDPRSSSRLQAAEGL